MYSCQKVILKTKIIDKEIVRELTKPICDFANKHDICFSIGYDGKGQLVADYKAEGKTSAYCKGMIAEIKQMLKDAFNCKIEVLFYAY